MSRVNDIPRRDIKLRARSGRNSPKGMSICVPGGAAGEIDGLKIGEASLCLRVAVEELMYGSWSGSTRRYRVADIGKVVPLNGGVLTSDIDGGVSGRPCEGEEVTGVGVEVRVDEVERGKLVSRPDPDRAVTRRAEEPTFIRGVFQGKHAARVPPELCLKSVRANIPDLDQSDQLVRV